MTKRHTMEAYIGALATAPDLETLETRFQALHRTPEGQWQELPAQVDRQVRQALEQRGWALIDAHPRGERVPKIVRKPSSFRGTRYRGHTFVSGTWGNGPGYRWTKANLEHLVQRVGEFDDLRWVENFVAWILSGFPHRALAMLLAHEEATTLYHRT